MTADYAERPAPERIGSVQQALDASANAGVHLSLIAWPGSSSAARTTTVCSLAAIPR